MREALHLDPTTKVKPTRILSSPSSFPQGGGFRNRRGHSVPFLGEESHGQRRKKPLAYALEKMPPSYSKGLAEKPAPTFESCMGAVG